MKQTAVDWLFKKMDVIGYSDIPTSVTASKEVWGQIYKKAKEMEKEQMLNFYMWMRMNEKAEEYFHYTDEDMFAEYLKQEQ
jgi:hypothetical protein